MTNTKYLFLFFISVLFFIIGCEEVDDQTIAIGKEWLAANPKPLIRNFISINQNHKVIVAVIDSGVDYNQPYIADNIHFDLDEAGQPKSFGYDFIGKDYWASPYVARTLDLNPEADLKDAKATKNARMKAMDIIKREPKLASYLNPSRNVEQEIDSGAFHGTHVAGLMVYDEPQIGLLAYRVLPVNVKYKNGKKDYSAGGTESVFKDILSAMALAIKSGARVINMSLALKSPSLGGLGGLLSDDDKTYKLWMNQVKNFMESHKDVVFVAAAGNEGKWVDNKVNLQIPCGISAANLICVGALDANGNLASFSNIVLSEGVFVATLGVDVNSITPSLMCNSANINSFQSESRSLESMNYFITQLLNDCKPNKTLRKASGTSMASPIVARTVAKLMIEYPNLDADQIIKIVVERSEKKQLGPLLLNVVKFEKPSWDN